MEKVRTVTSNAFNSPSKIIGILILVLIAGGILSYTLARSFTPGQEDKAGTDTDTDKKAFDIPYTIIYGTWTTSNTLVNAYNLQDGNEYTLATLPINIKKATFINSEEILYIADTSDTDHGEKLVIKNIPTGEERIIYNSLNGYGIDDYQISPNGRYLVTWEVILSPLGFLKDGKSKLVSIDMNNPGATHTLIEEDVHQTVLYPIAVTDNGRVFYDRFLPNSGAGWAYGMAVSNIDGSEYQDIESMSNGTYGTQPKLSPDGQYLAFAAYTSSDGAQVEDGFRKAIFSSNTLALLNTSTLEYSQLPNLNSEYSYIKAMWSDNDSILFKAISSNADETGTYMYNLSSNNAQLIDSELNQSPFYELPDMKTLLGRINTDLRSIVGNLGDTYSAPYLQVSLKDNRTDETEIVPLSASLIQVIDVTQNTEKLSSMLRNNKNLGLRLIEGSTHEADRKNLRLKQLVMKESLEPTRKPQQSDPVPEEQEESAPTPTTQAPSPTPKKKTDSPGIKPADNDKEPKPEPTWIPGLPSCDEVADKLVAQKCGSLTEEEKNKGGDKVIQYNQCRSAATSEAYDGMWKTCNDSPLYLYGPEGLTVDVNIHTPIFNSSIPQSNGEFSFALGKNGTFYSQGNSYSSLAFDYTPAKKLRTPLYGKVVYKEEVEEVVRYYAQRLGLQKNETNDLVRDIKAKVEKDYAFITFFSQDASKYMLPISFDPLPDTYINHIFYVKNLNSQEALGYSPKEPQFEKTTRGEFTAVEISVLSH